MTTTPAGRPAWERANDHTSYGGHTEKANYQGIPVINPKTDVGAEHLARMAADLAAVQRVAYFARVTFTAVDTPNAGDPTVSAVDLMTGVYSGAPYDGGNPPTGYPSVERIADGQYRVTFAASYDDPYGVTGALDLSVGMASAYKAGTTDTFDQSVNPLGSNAFDVYVYDTPSGTASQNPTVTVTFR